MCEGTTDTGSGKGCRKAKYLCYAWRALLSGSSLAPAISAIFVHWPAGPIAQKGLGLVALFLAGFHTVNVRTRIRLEHWWVPELAGVLCWEMLIGIVLPLVIAIVAVVLPPSWTTLLGMAVIFFIVHSLYEPIEEHIHDKVANEGKRQGTSRYEERQPFRFFHLKVSIKEIARGQHGFGLQWFLGFWVKPSWRKNLSRTRTVLLYVMLASALIAGGAAAQVALQEHTAPISIFSHGASDPPLPPLPEATVKPPSTGASGETLEEAGEGEAAEGETAECLHMPSYGAPPWAREDLDALYYGGKDLHATPPPGGIGGCTGKAVVPADLDGTFVYAVGRNADGEIRSVAVDSLEFGPAIFLAPSAQQVLKLIEEGVGPLGGYPMLEVAGGDLVAVVTEQGVFVLLRAAKHLPDQPEMATPYVVMPPTVAAAWAGTIREFGEWLWPLASIPAGNSQTFPLSPTSSGEEGGHRITFHPGSGTAQRDQYSYSLPQPRLSEEELEALAESTK